METPFQSILNLLIESPGNIVYHLVLAFAIISSLQAALISRRSKTSTNTNRLALGLGMLLLGQAILYIFSGLAWQNMIDGWIFLPSLDRAIILFNLVWLIWIWSFPSPARLGDLVTGFLNLGIVILFLFSSASWGQQNSFQHFNHTWIDQMWTAAGLILALTGMAILLFSRPAGWEFGLGMFSLILAGTIAHLLLAPADQDFSSYIRLGELAAFPLLPTLLYRLNQPSLSTETASLSIGNASSPPVPFPRTQERRRFSADPRTLQAWLSLASTQDPGEVLPGVAKALAHTMLSDICFIISETPPDLVTLLAGYDLIQEESLPDISLDQKKLPALSTALKYGKTLAIVTNDAQSPDLVELNAALGLKEQGSLLYIPLFTSGNPNGGILFLSPYSNRQWNTDDQGYLAQDLEAIKNVILQARQMPESSENAGQANQAMNAELENLRQDNKILLLEIDEYRKSAAHTAQRPQDTDLNALVALQQEAQEQISNLQAENDRLRARLENNLKPSPVANESARIEQDLRNALHEIATQRNQLAEANARNLALEQNARKSAPSKDNLDVITSIVQEIRQPLASISGYTELLLNESVGILGTLQRKFLERIEASNERLRSSLDDLIHVTRLSEGLLELAPQSIEIGAIIDSAVADTSAQLREKDIALRVDLPAEMPRITVDRDAVQQIVLHLLHNAGAVTPQESAITLRARIQKENDADFLLIQVTDSGGGIRAEDLPHVFSRHYRANKPFIQGLGDTGVGLSIAKTLVEAHHGRIWVDSIYGQGATISVLLPMAPDLAAAKSQ